MLRPHRFASHFYIITYNSPTPAVIGANASGTGLAL